ncbi:lipase ZK262.3-like [Ruditapes philippinarum]|uniref:lipase ZK262.3-like n=1 Tax=Ruditapes philippinarum TaxID=129788 RepID=UPI00295A5DAB|nr:lipase ZK262.3-like [Ruditapes philippinarum]
MTNTCHTPGSFYNNCKNCKDSRISTLCNVVDSLKCDRSYQNGSKSGLFEPYEASNATFYSALAYTDEPVECANRIKEFGHIKIVEIIGRKCNYLFKYKECYAITAVSHSMKKIILAYRGTTSPKQLIEEFTTVLGKFKVSTKVGGKIQVYFSNANDQIYPCAKASLKDLVNKYPSYRVIITGHSLGGAVASIAAAQLVFDNVINNKTTTLYTFGMPRPGDRKYAMNHDKYLSKSWRIVHYRDIVAMLPTMTVLPSSPYHHQREIFYGADMSMFSDYIECFEYEDEECRIAPSKKSIEYHRTYYGIKVGSLCDENMNRRKRSDDVSSMSHLFNYATCRRIRVADMVTSGSNAFVYGVTNLVSTLLCLTSILYILE